MFDKFLCGKIHKKEITIGDIAEKIIEKLGPFIMPLGLLTVCYVFIIDTVKEAFQVTYSTAFITVMKWTSIATGVLVCCGIAVKILCKITMRISKIKIAECPLNKETQEKQ